MALAPGLAERVSEGGIADILRGLGGLAMLAAIGLTVSDILLPVPTTAVMAALGLLHGPALGGAAASLGAFLAGMLACAIARGAGPETARRLAGRRGLAGAGQLFARWGGWRVALSRWRPVLPETVALVAGLVAMPLPASRSRSPAAPCPSASPSRPSTISGRRAGPDDGRGRAPAARALGARRAAVRACGRRLSRPARRDGNGDRSRPFLPAERTREHGGNAMRLPTLLAATALAATMSAPSAGAAEHGDMKKGDMMKVYAAMAKLEANMAEAAGAVMMAAAGAGDERMQGEAAADFQSDLGQIDAYVIALEGMELTDSQQKALDTFKSEWGDLVNVGRALIENADDSSAYRERVAEWWQSLDSVDDAIDAELEAILEEQGVSVSG
jgi:membrane protein YqaA with SNARE-associated domain